MVDDNSIQVNTGSFRDPSGFIFIKENTLYRQINLCYKDEYDFLMNSKLYDKLIENNLLIYHTEVPFVKIYQTNGYKTIRPDLIPFISYPYEWCFSQLQQAALLTLKILETSLQYGMTIKDASAFNIQFVNCKPIHIDTLSFERYKEGDPWVAYRQFCQHFFAPLALMSYSDTRMNQLLKTNIDGLPLDLTCKLLPWKSLFNVGVFSHLFIHEKSQKHYSIKNRTSEYNQKLSRHQLFGIIDNLRHSIEKLKCNENITPWEKYYDDNNYSEKAFEHKKELISAFLTFSNPKIIYDIGANTGYFSKMASERGIFTVSFDSDSTSVEKNYNESITKNQKNILPLILDIANPSPGIGWGNEERSDLLSRGKVDALVALALIHHLVITCNIPLFKIAQYFHKLCKYLIVEFVPKTDSQVKRLLANRDDVFADYTVEAFEEVFSSFFMVCKKEQLTDSQRIVYWMKKDVNDAE